MPEIYIFRYVYVERLNNDSNMTDVLEAKSSISCYPSEQTFLVINFITFAQ